MATCCLCGLLTSAQLSELHVNPQQPEISVTVRFLFGARCEVEVKPRVALRVLQALKDTLWGLELLPHTEGEVTLVFSSSDTMSMSMKPGFPNHRADQVRDSLRPHLTTLMRELRDGLNDLHDVHELRERIVSVMATDLTELVRQRQRGLRNVRWRPHLIGHDDVQLELARQTFAASVERWAFPADLQRAMQCMTAELEGRSTLDRVIAIGRPQHPTYEELYSCMLTRAASNIIAEERARVFARVLAQERRYLDLEFGQVIPAE